MKVSNLLRYADPLSDDLRHLDDARDRIRQAVVAAASVAPLPTGPRPTRRRVFLAATAALAVFAVVGMLVGSGGQGTVQAAVRFEVRLAETRPIPGLIVAQVGASQEVIYLHPEIVVTNDDIAQSWVLPDGPKHFSVSVEFLPAAAQRLQQATATHLGRPLAILIDGEVVMAPVIRSAVSSSALITGTFTRADAERIAEGIGTR